MHLAQGLDGDHSIARAHGGTVADRLLHSWCNRERGDGSRDHLRPALTGKPIEDKAEADDRAAWCVMQGW
ncbi:hypothetical protein [Nocardia pseudovaccinii]|uniref:hypothetical protein n=1 Tax=Nocardia pseudovaccinii TaxID=189540 RepID=UPI000ABDCBFB|nr:hypothetical protein [Nocardia pseudovaccinii]